MHKGSVTALGGFSPNDDNTGALGGLPRRARRRVLFDGIALLALDLSRVFDTRSRWLISCRANVSVESYVCSSGSILGKIDYALPPS
jgi:hypothetical protein